MTTDSEADDSGPAARPIVVREATRAELQDALDVQHAAFERVARMFGIPPERLSAVTETLDTLTEQSDGGVLFLVAVAETHVVGTVRARVRPDGVVEVGRLAVDEAVQRRGVGRRLMGEVELRYPQARRFELFTGAEAEGPLALYGSLGYLPFRRQAGESVDIVWLAKERD